LDNNKKEIKRYDNLFIGGLIMSFTDIIILLAIFGGSFYLYLSSKKKKKNSCCGCSVNNCELKEIKMKTGKNVCEN